jgi:CO/xanthine dehydrogenase Mo-binding subunit
MTGLKCHVIDDYGAYFQFGVGHHGNALSQITGPYRLRSVRLDLTAVLTNKCQQGAYRGFGSDVGNFVLERMVDAAVAELNDDAIEFRRRNFIRPDQFPYLIPTGNMYDSGNYPAVLDRALGLLDHAGWRKKQEEGRQSGRYIGIGIATCQERSVFSATEFWMLNEDPGFALTSSPESVSLKMDPTGKVYVALQAPFWGNSPETVATQSLNSCRSIPRTLSSLTVTVITASTALVLAAADSLSCSQVPSSGRRNNSRKSWSVSPRT